MSSSTHYHIPPYGGYGPNDGDDVEEEEAETEQVSSLFSYVNRLGEIENSNVDLERRLNDNMMDTMERIRQEHAGHRRAIEEKEHEIGVLRHECETERNVRNREVSNLKASLENEKRLLGEARAREEELVNECRIKISDLEADFASRERILVDQKEEMERSLRAAIKRLENEVEDRCESFRAEEMVWEKLRGDTEGKLVELTADNSRLRQEVKELRAQLAEVQEKLRKAEVNISLKNIP
ncbi:M protein, serotype 49 precursor, putative [Perkinsus marinus ATCC 50983]|uniref:M protein, serotype 49, putative n=1 Tax=Perkinsus marinus (strain ATCC 50983 / TXsc) TaxID=423536 RepID=C5KAH3_PERM5|nr:M protein, serotype 49 precursor, putative [Perkinsus marinus ATCC 50983]EER18509.1 M protein, serotype 49 precursor, putative [Perkinsus marinus ATCC 50983]|eukprot:XP_002786713.1 M protein, serotype 49 precursor, putative [Perkinsus marinus ATCC 50983]